MSHKSCKVPGYSGVQNAETKDTFHSQAYRTKLEKVSFWQPQTLGYSHVDQVSL